MVWWQYDDDMMRVWWWYDRGMMTIWRWYDGSGFWEGLAGQPLISHSQPSNTRCRSNSNSSFPLFLTNTKTKPMIDGGVMDMWYHCWRCDDLNGLVKSCLAVSAPVHNFPFSTFAANPIRPPPLLSSFSNFSQRLWWSYHDILPLHDFSSMSSTFHSSVWWPTAFSPLSFKSLLLSMQNGNFPPTYFGDGDDDGDDQRNNDASKFLLAVIIIGIS